MGNDVNHSVTLSIADVKDRSRLIQEVAGFANTLLQTASEHNDAKGSIILTFDRKSGVDLALTIHQLLAVMRTMEKN